MKIAVIGLGGRGLKFIDAVKQSNGAELVAVCDLNTQQVAEISQKYKTAGYTSVETLLHSPHKPDMAIVALPHNEYLTVITLLAKHQVHVLKEKPFACNLQEAHQLAEVLQHHQTHMMVGVQRRFDIIYQTFPGMLARLGKIYSIEGRYSLCIDRCDTGWRADKKQAGGGALLDMGYHILDLLLWYFGKPSQVELLKTTRNRFNQHYDVEDTAILSFDYQQKFMAPEERAIGTIKISRLGYKTQEKLVVSGMEGHIVLKRDSLRCYDIKGKLMGQINRDANSVNPLINMIEHYIRFLQGQEKQLLCDYREHFAHMEIIDAAYQQPLPLAKPADYVWPLLTKRSEQAVLNQLRKGEISIYNRSGIFKLFEDRFKQYHDRHYALLTNSGTSALHSAYEGLNLKPGDEVIVPDYTFFATATPLFHFGAKPVLCDCLPDGNIDPVTITQKITARTKAVVITHMWGIPCDMDEIMAICKQHQLALIEDCSHAHGARYKNQLVGTFGDAAIWSLQGQKIITGGEGGILLTNNEEIYVRAQLLGQYNKRCEQEINPQHPLFKFNTTGFGLKLRAHPLAIALANEQFDHLDQWLTYKRQYATYIIEQLNEISFLRMPTLSNKTPAWYALTFFYDETKSNCTIDEFIQQLHAKGLTEIERPKSTRPLHQLPLFKQTAEALPRFFKNNETPSEPFPVAEKVYTTAIKMPVWARPEDKPMVEKYVQGIKAVAQSILTQQVNTAPIPRARL